LARGTAAVCCATTCVTAAQAATLTATYLTPPEASGPRRGRCAARRGEGEDASTTTASVTSVGAYRTDATRRERRDASRRTIVAYVAGDSTACGVGCETTPVGSAGGGDGGDRGKEDGKASRGGRGPTLAVTFADAVGEKLGANVEWRALGFKGADVRSLRDKLIPALREAMSADDAEASSSSAPDAVVLMCGINDAKHSIVGRTSSDFRNELRELVREVRDVVGDRCVVVLPATPLDAATLFPPPLAWVATRMNDLWDAQKAHVSEIADNVLFVSKPGVDALRARVAEETGRVAHNISLICRDGIHPNDDGYAAWARHIADECLPTLKRALAEEKR